ncbi:Growth hormone-regulated TBC protein 1-A [Lamellibrachia satsuma]|nr:Growth hormone-regulated TBC protein 1-A [Lamellibrachia satsuma]
MSDSVANKVDPYGFERPDDFDYENYEDFMAHYLSVLAKRSQKWESRLHRHSLGSTKGKKLKKYIRKGIPSAHRTEVWMLVSGAEARRRQQPDLYRSLLNSKHDAELVEMIKSDIPRTFPDNIFFQDVPSDPNAKRVPLYHVLIALAHKNQHIGYCQGLNFIAGLMLLVVRQEEKVFWLMDTLLNHILPDYYSRDMLAMKVDQAVLGDLVRWTRPCWDIELCRNLTEGPTVGDELCRNLTEGPTVSDELCRNLTEGSTVSDELCCNLTEGPTVSDELCRNLTEGSTVSDELCRNLTEGPTVSDELCRNLTEGPTVSDELCRNLTEGPTVSDELCCNLTEGPTVSDELCRNLTEGSTVSDELCRNLTEGPTVSDELCRNLTEGSTVSDELCRNLTEGPTVSDELRRNLTEGPTVSDELCCNLTEGPTVSDELRRNLTEGPTVSDELRLYPAVAEHVEREGVSWTIVSTKWFICLYADVIPIETVLRIWDCIFHEGSTVILRVALALVAKNQTKILRCANFTELVTLFKGMTSDPYATNCHNFMKHVFKTKVKRSKIEKLRTHYQQQLRDEA